MTTKAKLLLMRLAFLALLLAAGGLLVLGVVEGRTGAMGGAVAALAAAAVSLFSAERRVREGGRVIASGKRLALLLGVEALAVVAGATLAFLVH